MSSGNALREIRTRLRLSMRDVELQSREFADREGIPDLLISSAWLTQIENSESTPSIYKLYTLSMLYRMDFSEMMKLFGLDLDQVQSIHLGRPLQVTHMAGIQTYDKSRTVQFPVLFDKGFSTQETNLLSRMVEIWGEIPLGVLQQLNLKSFQYGFIGTDDNTMFPLIRPGSFVQIDDKETSVARPPWKSEFDRPIYFIELRDRYICSWCELHEGELFIVPHPQSGIEIQRYAYPRDAEVVGRVTAVAMKIMDMKLIAKQRQGRLAFS